MQLKKLLDKIAGRSSRWWEVIRTTRPPIEIEYRVYPRPGEIWQHCGGATYQILGIHPAISSHEENTETHEFYACSAIAYGEMVVFYRNAAKPTAKVYGRSLTNFMEEISPGVFRFEQLES